MNAYLYLPQERRCGEEGRKSRVKVGIIFEYVDRRQTDRELLSRVVYGKIRRRSDSLQLH